MKNRIAYIDNTRAILIVFVVLVHILNAANPDYDIIPYTLTQAFISSFHMPAFFLLSGMMTDTDRWKNSPWYKFFLRKIQTLIVPYVFFETIAVLYKHFVLKAVSLTEGLYLMATMRCNVGADWFLPAMFLAGIIYFLYIKWPNKIFWGIVAAVCFFTLPFLPKGHWWRLLFRGLLGFVFMVAGNLLKNFLADFKSWKIIGAFFLTAASAAVCFKFSLANDFYGGVLQSPILFIISGICGLYFVMGFARLFHMRWLAWIGENSLAIMGTHQLVLYTVPTSSSLLWVAGVFFLIAVIEVIFIITVNRFCPFLVGKNRKEQKNACNTTETSN